VGNGNCLSRNRFLTVLTVGDILKNFAINTGVITAFVGDVTYNNTFPGTGPTSSILALNFSQNANIGFLPITILYNGGSSSTNTFTIGEVPPGFNSELDYLPHGDLAGYFQKLNSGNGDWQRVGPGPV